jgi:hypothetical protein
MNIERIKEIQYMTDHPDSHSVFVALKRVWEECEKTQGIPEKYFFSFVFTYYNINRNSFKENKYV